MKHNYNRHNNQYSTRDPRPLYLMLGIMAVGFTLWMYGEVKIIKSIVPFSPMGIQVEASEPVVVNPTAGMNTDALIDYYSTKYTSKPNEQAHRKALLHCLYWKETRGGIDAGARGDNGLAGGPFQFHEPTYKSMRSKMIKEGVANEMGSRDNFENAVDTTSWAISQGQGKAWGPILRGECK